MDHERPLTTSYFFDLRFLPGYLFGIFKLSYWSGTIASCHSPARNVLRVRQGQTKDYEIGVCCFSAKYSPQGVSATNEWISHVNRTSLSVYVHWFSHVHINYSLKNMIIWVHHVTSYRSVDRKSTYFHLLARWWISLFDFLHIDCEQRR